MTMKAIANEVGIKAPSLYAFYASKEDILLHIYTDVLTKHLGLAAAATNEDPPSVEQELKAFLDQVMAFQLRDSAQLKIFIRLLLFPPDFFDINLKEELTKLVEEERVLLRRLFETGMARGEIKNGDPDAIAALLLCLMDGFFWEMQRYDEASFRNRYAVVWNQFWESIKA